MSSGGTLYDPHVPQQAPPPTQMSAYPPPPPPGEPAPQYQPAPPAFQPAPGYQPVAQQSTSNTTVAVVNTAPTICAVVPEYPPPTYMVLNVFTLLCCCFLFGLIGVFYSIQVESEWSRGNRVGAMSASRTAKNWGIAGIVTGSFSVAGVIILSIIVNVTTAASSSSSNDDY